MGDYAGLQGTIDQIVEAAIDWAMADAQWTRSGTGYRMNGSLGWWVPGPDAGPGAFPVEFTDPRVDGPISYDFYSNIYQPITESVQSQFDPWLTMPEPGDFATLVQNCFGGTQKISNGQEVNGDTIDANVDLDAAITGGTDALTGQWGATITAFKRQYMDRMPGVVTNHCAAAADLTEIVLGEQYLWWETQKSVASTADAMLAAMQARSGGDGEVVLSVLGAALSVAAAVASGGWAVALTAAGAAAGVGATLEGGGGSSESVPLSGGSPFDVIDSVHGVLVDLNAKVIAEEEDLVQKATSRAGQMDGSDYDLTVPVSLYEGGSEDDYSGGGNLMQVQFSALEDLYEEGGYLEVIADQLRTASTELNGVSAFGAFSRARVGLVNDGPYSEWNALRLKIVDFLEVNRQACIDAGDQLQIAAGFIRDTDDAVSADLGQHGDEVENADTFSLAPPSGNGAPGGYGGR